MSLSTRQPSPPKRPRLSLAIKTPATAQTFGRSSTALKADIDPTSATAFNTLSNAYAAAIEASSPRTTKPPTLDLNTVPNGKPTSLRLETKLTTGGNSSNGKPTSLKLDTKTVAGDDSYILPSQHYRNPVPFAVNYPDTPSSAIDRSTPLTAHPEPKSLALTCTFTPPQSAGATDLPQLKVFTFAANTSTRESCGSPRTPRRRATIGSQFQVAPYTHPRSLHSILRNSPLPPRTTATPGTPTRSSLRIANRAAKKVGYNDPLEQTITTNTYVKSHIDLLSEESPYSATDVESESPDLLDQAMEYVGDETRDGGHTPGPFEEMRRRMADNGLETPSRRKRKRKEKKRLWEWTIPNADVAGDQDVEMKDQTPITAIKIKDSPDNTAWRETSVSTGSDMSDAGDRQRDLSVDSSTGSDERPGTSQSL